jgi:protein O-mannosyl-transferase
VSSATPSSSTASLPDADGRGAGANSGGSQRGTYAALAAAVAALLLYAASLSNGFAFDDAAIIAADPRIHGFDIGAIFGGGYWLDEGHALYRPLTTLSFALDWSLAPGNPAWFHLQNAVLHALASAIVALLLARLWTPAGALLGGLVFAVHPVHVEAVANVVGRAELLAAVFFLAACRLWIRRGQRLPGELDATPSDRSQAAGGSTLILPDSPETRARDANVALRRVAVPVLYAFAVFSKESAIMLPAVLPLLDVATIRLRRQTLRAYIRRDALAYALLAAVAIAYLVVRASVLGDTLGGERLAPSLEVVHTTGGRILTALQVWPEYLRLMLVPVTLLADYGPRITAPATSVTRDVALGGVILGAVLAAGAVALLLRVRRSALGYLWFPITILPVSNLLLPIGVLIAERTLYLPSVAVCFAAAALAERGRALPRRARQLAAAAAIAIVALFAARSAVRIPEWQSTDRILLALVRDRPDAFRGQWHLARMARAAGDSQAALERYAHALELWPYRQRLVFETIGFSSAQGALDYAAGLSDFAVRQWPGSIDAHRFRAATTLDRGDTIAARQYVREGLAVDPTDDALQRMRAAIGDPAADGAPR